MPAVEVAEQAGGDRSEDVVLVTDHAVAVLDGATSLRPRSHSGGWYAAELAEALRPRLESEADLASLLAGAITEITGKHDLHRDTAPSSTVSLLRWDDDVVEGLVLADSPLVVFTDAGEHPLTDERLAGLGGTGNSGYRERLRQGGGFDPGHQQALQASGDVTGRWRNVDGGFWVARTEPEAAFRAYRGRWPRADVRTALLATDGVSCGVDDYEIFPNWSAVLDEAREHGLDSVLRRVRDAERSDPHGQRWPRPKRHDDQALARVRY